MTELVAPFPFFGGKRRAASRIWAALGDPGGYIEPFAGSAAVLLARPHYRGRRVETLNDADGWLVNAWRAIQMDPVATARHAAGPCTEIDYHARLAWLQERRTDDLVSWLEGDPEHHDAKAAGWWLYVMAAGIGDPFQSGPWQVRDGRLQMGTDDDGVARTKPYLSSAGQGVQRVLPALGAARGVMRGEAAGDLAGYLAGLAERIRHVRITCGSWERVLTPAAIAATAGKPGVAILMDPPYATSGDLYASTNQDDRHKTVSAEVREWCLTRGRGYRIVLCGYENEHDDVLRHGWTKDSGVAGSGNGYNKTEGAGKRERLWYSPECHSDALFDLDFGGEVGSARASGWGR